MTDIEQLENSAVNAAVKAHWESAVDYNKKILEVEENNLPAHLRLGFAYLQMKQLNQAKKHYNSALKLQPGNPVAQENLEKISILNAQTSTSKSAAANLNPNLFLEIPGKTKSVVLVNLGQRDVLAHLAVGQKVVIKPKKRKIEIRNTEGDYVGTLPDDICRRLLAFIEADSVYSAYIKEASLNRVIIFIREEKKGPKVMMHISFTQNIQPDLQTVQNKEDSEDEESDEEEEEKDHLEVMIETLDRDPEEVMNYRNSDEDDGDSDE
jgi:tetratricopeptide (TPR) repeat protein